MILRSLVSGTQNQFQSNHAGLEPAAGKQKTHLTRGTSFFQSEPAPAHLGHELSRWSHGPHSPQRTLHVILGSLVSGTQHLFQTNRDRPVPAAGMQEALLTRDSSPFLLTLALGHLGYDLSGWSHNVPRELST